MQSNSKGTVLGVLSLVAVAAFAGKVFPAPPATTPSNDPVVREERRLRTLDREMDLEDIRALERWRQKRLAGLDEWIKSLNQGRSKAEHKHQFDGSLKVAKEMATYYKTMTIRGCGQQVLFEHYDFTIKLYGVARSVQLAKTPAEKLAALPEPVDVPYTDRNAHYETRLGGIFMETESADKTRPIHAFDDKSPPKVTPTLAKMITFVERSYKVCHENDAGPYVRYGTWYEDGLELLTALKPQTMTLIRTGLVKQLDR
jgi:hypothetical protein